MSCICSPMGAASRSCGGGCAGLPGNTRPSRVPPSGSSNCWPAPITCPPSSSTPRSWAAKGLEAPCGFRPDTMKLPDRQVPLLWSERDGLPLWRPRKELAVAFHTAERDAFREHQLQEYRRLLYVALTRAQDRLYVCGWQTRRPDNSAPCWHTLCQAGWSGIATPFAFDTRPLLGDRDGWAGDGLRLSSPQTEAPSRDRAPGVVQPLGVAPAWAKTAPPAEPDPPKPLLPSRPSGPEPATLSPLAVAGRDRSKRGLLAHRPLQSLPALPEPQREA